MKIIDLLLNSTIAPSAAVPESALQGSGFTSQLNETEATSGTKAIACISEDMFNISKQIRQE